MSIAVDSAMLSERPHLSDAVFNLLQNEWPIHDETRRRALEQKPYEARVLLLSTADATAVLGHAQLKWATPAVCLVVSVVVNRAYRRQRLGCELMTHVERRCVDKVQSEQGQSVTLYLWTSDQEAFFERAGYRTCAPYEGRHTAVARLDATQQADLSSMLLRRRPATFAADPDDSPNGVVWMRKDLAW
ncbi:hypothetical protein ACHHYP_04173 [Achlya hypogyna]|uniref:N-acetyltransferase domain-containing protein n=1 Tax=Achlya hypogyna TaxID=1202772 RepID=A0A1V9Z1Z7_ACHHY|nr:hypothetical protein ACHHYP_04173 [Achlya hypogyna]